VEYFQRMGGVGVGVQLLAPRGNPGSRCALEAAKANLVHGCMRFLLAERMSEGVKRLGAALPDMVGGCRFTWVNSRVERAHLSKL
jgi:hypothetical protein